MSWYFFAILAAVVWAVSNVIDRVTYTKFIKKAVTPMLVFAVLELLTVAILAVTTGIDSFSPYETLLGLIAGFTYSLMFVFYVLAVRREEISKVVPLFGLAPIFVMVLAAVTLGEVFTPLVYIGIALTLLGAVTLSVQRGGRFRFNAAFWFMVGAAASAAVTEVVSKHLLNSHDYWSVFAYTRGISGLTLLPIALWGGQELAGMIRQRRIKVLSLIFLAEALNMMGILCILIAASKGYVTLVNAITQIQPFIVLLLAVLLSRVAPQILKEEGGLRVFIRKLGSITIMFIGVILILWLQA